VTKHVCPKIKVMKIVSLLLLLAAPAAVQAQCGGYIISADEQTTPTTYTITIIGCDGNGTPVDCTMTIPSTIAELPVTAIAELAYYDCTGLSSITIPGSVTSIASDAFSRCPLTSVYFTGNAPPLTFPPYIFGTEATVYYLPGTSGWGSTFVGLPTVLWNPVIQTDDGSFGITNNQFGFNITNANNLTVAVEVCTNLAEPVWITLQTVTLTNGSFYFNEPFQANSPARFYRLSLPNSSGF
jgi:hypothetical protein